MINSVCGIRSTGRICTDIAEQLRMEGHECRIGYGRESVPERYGPYALRIGSELGVRLHGLHARVFDSAGFGSKAATRRLVRQMRAYDPDVIHLHNLHGYYLDVQTLFAYLKEAGKPVVWTLHDCWPFTGHCAYFSAAGCEKWRQQCHHCGEKRSYPASIALDRSRENFVKKKASFTGVPALTLVTPSLWLAELTRDSFLREDPVAVIPNGIDLQVFCPTEGDFRQQNHLEDKKIVLGVASVWETRKGLADLVQLAKLLREDYTVVVVGVTPQQKQDLPSNMIGICRTEDARQLAHLYTTADVFVNPTYEDNYPTVNLEAQACGTPVITYCTGGSVESVPAHCVVAQGDVEALAKKIRSETAACRKDVPLGRESMLQRYLQLYRTLI